MEFCTFYGMALPSGTVALFCRANGAFATIFALANKKTPLTVQYKLPISGGYLIFLKLIHDSHTLHSFGAFSGRSGVTQSVVSSNRRGALLKTYVRYRYGSSSVSIAV